MWTRRLCLRIGITTLPPALFVGHDIPTHTVLFRSGWRVPHHHRVVPPAAERGAGSSAAVPLHRALLSLLGRGALLLPAEIHHLAGTVTDRNPPPDRYCAGRNQPPDRYGNTQKSGWHSQYRNPPPGGYGNTLHGNNGA